MHQLIFLNFFVTKYYFSNIRWAKPSLCQKFKLLNIWVHQTLFATHSLRNTAPNKSQIKLCGTLITTFISFGCCWFGIYHYRSIIINLWWSNNQEIIHSLFTGQQFFMMLFVMSWSVFSLNFNWHSVTPKSTFYLLQFFVLHFNLNTRLQWLREILKGAQVQSTCNTIAAPLEMLPRHRLYRLTAMTSTASLLTRVCCWAVDISASLGCSSACTNYQQHPQSDVVVRPPPIWYYVKTHFHISKFLTGIRTRGLIVFSLVHFLCATEAWRYFVIMIQISSLWAGCSQSSQ
jgi:hypothetical protein